MTNQMADDDNATTTFICKICERIFQDDLAYWRFQHLKRTVSGNILSIAFLKPGEWNYQGKRWNCKRDRRVIRTR
jgi:hypothetical protein